MDKPVQIHSEGHRPDGSWEIHSEQVATVELSGPDGKAARFFVMVGVDHQGKPWASITGRRNGDEDSTKRVGASWINFAARRKAVGL